MSAEFKHNLRQKILAQRKSLSSEEISIASKKISNLFCQSNYFLKYNDFASYVAANGEVDAHPIIKALWQAKKRCFLPLLHPTNKNELLFQLYEEGDPLVKNIHRILEPVYDEKKLLPAEKLDIVLMPLVAFDSQGNRLGMGAGYYDRSLAFHKDRQQNPLLIGLGYSFQQVEKLTPDDWDITLTTTLTEMGF